MPEYEREQESEGQRSAPTHSKDAVSVAVGKRIEPERSHGTLGATPATQVEGRYKPTFDPHDVKVPWSDSKHSKKRHPNGTKAQATAIDGGEVHVDAYILGTGTPKLEIFENVNRMADARNDLVTRFGLAVAKVIQIVEHAAFKKAPAGLIAKLWGRVEALLTRGAAVVTGGALGAKFGLAAIKKILAKGDELEALRVQSTKQEFLDGLNNNARSLEMAGVDKRSNPDVIEMTRELDQEFCAIGRQNPEDEWKLGDRGVVGAQAHFLKDLEKRSLAFVQSVPLVDDFVRELLSAWVSANAGEHRRPALRSPFKPSTVADGYISVDLTLGYNPLVGGWYLSNENEARLHCPGSQQVAHELTRTKGLNNFDELGIPIHLRITATDSAWEKLPPVARHDRAQELRFDSGRQLASASMKTYWHWLTSNSRDTSLTAVFQSIRVLKG